MHAFTSTRFVIAVALLLVAGCKTASPPPASQGADMQLAAHPSAAFPARPSVAPPAFKVFHQTDNSITLVTKGDASDDEVAAIVWELRDAARAHSFDKLGISQKFVDARNPMVWIHIYRGAKCASEKYTTGKLPCGAAYHAAGDYTLGGFHDKDHDDGVLLKDENHEVHLWNPNAPQPSH